MSVFENDRQNDVRRRYQNDPTYHAIVTAMNVWLIRGEVTTAELASATVLAAQLYAEQNNGPVTILLREGEDLDWLDRSLGGEEKP